MIVCLFSVFKHENSCKQSLKACASTSGFDDLKASGFDRKQKTCFLQAKILVYCKDRKNETDDTLMS